MPGRTSGLMRDVQLVRRRAWVFIPFFILGIIAVLVLVRVAGDAESVANITVESAYDPLIQDNDRGLRSVDAETMTHDPRFIALVKAAAGDPNLDYSRFNIFVDTLGSVEGLSRGIVTVTVKDPNRSEADRLRSVWSQTFVDQFTKPGGLFRQLYYEKKQEQADAAEQQYAAALATVKTKADALGVRPDQLITTMNLDGAVSQPAVEELNRQEADLRSQLAQVDAALSSGAAASGVQASAILGVTVSDAAAQGALQQRKQVLTDAIGSIADQREILAATSQDPDLRAAVDNLSALTTLRNQSVQRVAAAQLAAMSARTTVEVENHASGGLGGTWLGRIAIVAAITIVFGVIAIYVLEWFLIVRRGPAPEPEHSAASDH